MTAPAVDMLAKGGRIAKSLPGFEPRPQQLAMARAVADAFEKKHHVLVEAGTGVGKSFAYLIPAIDRAVRHGQRVVVSTHTIALQEQLIQKDIPFLRQVFDQAFSAVLVKGRSNYVGLRRLARASARQEGLFSERERNDLWRIEAWAYETEDGSLADLPRQPMPAVWERALSDAHDCLGRKCPYVDKCFYQRARRDAAKAQLLIVNHALLFADLAVRREGASILPDYDLAVLDEAHTVEGVAGDHLGLSVAGTQVAYLLNGIYNERTGRGVLLPAVHRAAVDAVQTARVAADAYFSALDEHQASVPGWNGRLREPLDIEPHVVDALRHVAVALKAVRADTKDAEARSEIGGLIERCLGMSGSIARIHGQDDDGWVYWLEVSGRRRRRVTMNGRPIDVAPELKASLFDKTDSVVLTSATLTTASNAPFDYIKTRLGLGDTATVALGSPFNYREQVKVYVETGLPEPRAGDAFTTAACDAIRRYVLVSDGRAFVLFTSYSMLHQCAEALADFFDAQRMPLLVQGSGMPRSKMLERFRDDPRSVLFGTDTFWSGVDVPGDALANVIIVKLPFAVPDHPAVEARIERIRETGGNPFMEFQLPEAVLKFKQGFGRLIRTRTDRGMVVILDPRIQTKRYGGRFLDALPDCEVVMQSGVASVEPDRATSPTPPPEPATPTRRPGDPMSPDP
ncbi:MAG: ATP-dependent DNA helicase [Phycisphaerae bacterium]